MKSDGSFHSGGFFFFFLLAALFDHKQSSSNQGRFLALFLSLLRFLRVMNFLVLKSSKRPAERERQKERKQTEEDEEQLDETLRLAVFEEDAFDF